MSDIYTYDRIVQQAKHVKASVENDQKITGTRKWSYYFAKAIQNPKKDIKKIEFDLAKKSEGDYISRDIFKSSYTDMAKRVSKYIETNKRMPNYVKFTTKSGKQYNIECDMYVYMFAKILADGFPQPVNISSKVFKKPTESKGEIYDYFVKKTGITPKQLDDVCDWVKNKVTYQFYYDDQKTNKQVIDSKAGNCTDLLQFLTVMADALNYEWKVIHTQCRQSGVGHVYGQFKKKNSSEWFTRDIACIADESRYCVWCEVPNGGNQLAVNPNWFIQNRLR